MGVEKIGPGLFQFPAQLKKTQWVGFCEVQILVLGAEAIQALLRVPDGTGAKGDDRVFDPRPAAFY